jgi:hypothetical protein
MGRYLIEKVYNKKSYGNVIDAACIIGCFLINFSVVVGGIIETSILFSGPFGIPKIVVKSAVVLIFAIITGFVLEPERLKPIGSFCAVAYTIICNYKSKLRKLTHISVDYVL